MGGYSLTPPMCFVLGLALLAIAVLFPLNWVQSAFAIAGGVLWVLLAFLKAFE